MEYYLNGIKLQDGQPFQVGDLVYPWSYLEILSPVQLASFGITQVVSQEFDSRYYWNAETPKHLDDREESDKDGNPVYVQVWDPTFNNGDDATPGAMINTEERLISKGLKTICTAEVKTTANSILKKTDWYLFRLAEREEEVPANVTTHRAAIIAEAERLETAIANVADVEELISVMNSQQWDNSLNPAV